MKKNLLIAVTIVIAAVAATIVSCNKEKNEQMLNTDQSPALNADNMDDYLTAFKTRLLSAERGGETISMEQARRDLCNLLNFDFGDANYATDTCIYDTIHTKLCYTNDGEVSLSQLAMTYNGLLEAIINSYRSVTLPEKSILYISCDSMDTGNNENDAQDLEVIVCFRGFVGTRIGVHDTLDWRPGCRAGTCDGLYIGQYGGPEIQTQWLGQNYPSIDCPNGGRVYYTDEMYYTKVGVGTFDNVENKFKIYASYSQRQDTICISHEEMEYYFANIVDYWDNETPSDYVPMNNQYKVDITQLLPGTAFYQQYPEYVGWYTWYVYLHLGKPTCTGSDPLL